MTRRTANDTVQNLLSGAKLFGWRPSAVSFVVTLEQLLVLCALIWGLSALDDLIDGDQLAEKLKELGLGIKTEMVEEVSVNRDWFQAI